MDSFNECKQFEVFVSGDSEPSRMATNEELILVQLLAAAVKGYNETKRAA
jgi:hypothetical protein